MWNPFSRSNRPPNTDADDAPPGEEQSRPSPKGTTIAEIELIGPTAVATFTVTCLSSEEGVEQLVELLDELNAKGATHYVLDIQNVQHMDSACLGCLVEALNRMTLTGGRIALVNPDRNVEYLFKLTRLDRVFPICTDVMGALKAVERSAA